MHGDASLMSASRPCVVSIKESFMKRWLAAPRAIVGRVLVVTAAALSALPAGTLHAELTGPTAEDRQITLAVTRYMRDGHITRHELNDEIAQRLVTNFLKTLDVQKVFFYQSDIDAFRKEEKGLDDSIRRGNVDFAFQVFDTYLKRV